MWAPARDWTCPAPPRRRVPSWSRGPPTGAPPSTGNCGPTAEGAAGVQWTPLSVPDQAWSLVPVVVSGGTYALFNHNSGLALDVNGASTSDGAVVIQWPSHGGANQQWRFVSVGSGWYEV